MKTSTSVAANSLESDKNSIKTGITLSATPGNYIVQKDSAILKIKKINFQLLTTQIDKTNLNGARM